MTALILRKSETGVSPRLSGPAYVEAWRRANRPVLQRGLRKLAKARRLGLPHFYGSLYLKVLRASGEELDLGLASVRVVTNNGVAYIVQCFLGTGGYNLNDLKYHGIGTGATAENVTDATLVTELTTQYNPNSTRATGTMVIGASANIFRTAATNTVDSAVAITEHGIFSQAATGGGTLYDRSVFSVVNLASGDGLFSTYDGTIPAGS